MTITTKVTDNKDFQDNYESIFGDKKAERGSWVYDKVQQKMVPKDEYYGGVPENEHATILKQIDAFVSPIDGSIIDDRGKLREHNKRHGVTNVADYGPDYFDRKANERKAAINGNTKEAKRERIEALKRTMHDYGIHN